MAELELKPDLLLIIAEPTRAEICQTTLKTSNLASRIVWAPTASEGRAFLFCEGAHAGRNPADRPRVVFLEFGASTDDEFKFIRDVKSDDRFKRIPIVVIGTSADENNIFECYKNGGNSYVNMPDTLEQFGELMAQIGRYWLAVNRSPS